MKPDAIVPNAVYVDASLARWRRVIALVDDGGETYVRYSIGSDSNRHCLLRTFARWSCKRIVVDSDGMVEEYPDEEELRDAEGQGA